MGHIATKRTLVRRIAAAIAITFSLLTIAEGSGVLLGIRTPDYVVLPALVLYNVIMGAVGLVAGIGVWANRRSAIFVAGAVSGAHVLVLITVAALHSAGGLAAIHSVHAMLLRSGIWILVTWMAWQSREKTVPIEQEE